MPTKDFKIGRMNSRHFVFTEDGYSPPPNLYETEDIETEEEPMLWPKVNPYIKERVDAFCEAIPQIVEGIVNTLPVIIKATTDLLDSCTNRRVLYLATHGSPRVRKKNVKRLVRYYRRMQR